MSKFFREGSPLLLAVFLFSFVMPSYAYDVVSDNSEGSGSLAWAIQQANQGGDSTINIASSVKSITLSRELTIEASLTINGNGATISGNDSRRIFRITNGRTVFNAITFTKGNASSGNGGAVDIDGTNASAEFRNCTFFGCQAQTYGGAVCVTKGDENTATIFKHCTISGNMAANGGGIALVDGEMSLFSSIIVGNSGSNDIYASSSSSRYFRSRYNVAGSSSFAMDSRDLMGQTLSNILMTENSQPKTSTVNSVQVIQLLQTSPARDFIPSTVGANYVLSNDEIGNTRPQLTGYDAGAYEAMPYPIVSAEIYGTPYIQINDTGIFSVDIRPESASLNIRDYPPYGVEWLSSSPTVLSIDNTGRAQAKGIGSSFITAKVHGWNADGSAQTVSTRAFTVYVDEVRFADMKAVISRIESKSIAVGRYDTVKPEVKLTVGRYELSNLKGGISYNLTASSTRSDIVTAEVISGDTVRLMAGNNPGSCDVSVTATPIPAGQSMRTDFIVTVVSNDTTTLGRSGGGGGCDSFFMAGAMALSVFFFTLRTRKE